ncbi:glycosyltransferase, group 4 family [Bacteroides clarus YIT 12056]|nr:glycosyltransferase, group 4 family [Bacteroides clarus YIT 12056]
MTLLYLTGIADDLVGVRYRQKFVIQIFCACLFPLSGIWINDLYGLFGIHELSAYIGMPFTVLIIVFITNAINLIDGIDGLASGLSSVALLIFTFLFINKGLWSYAMLAAGTFGVLVPFFYYNVFGSVERARKIFMGDTGSLTLGYTLSFLAIKYSQHNTDIMPYTAGAFIIAFSTMIIPAFDVVRVVLVRIREGHSPFEPDKNHIHHKLLAVGLSPRKAMLSLLFMSCAFSAANILLVPYVNNTMMLIADIVIWIGLNLWWDYLRDKK